MLISVIVPVYKVEKYLKRCIDSILAQTFTDYELILVDDGSPDNCGCICDEYAKTNQRIHVIHKKNGGLSDARNAGIDWAFKNSNSKWITFIDSDDWVSKDYLKFLYKAIVESMSELAVCGFNKTSSEFCDDDDSPFFYQSFDPEEFFCMDSVNAVVAWGKLYLKNDFQRIRFPIGKNHEDEYTTYKVFFKKASITFINVPLYHYYQNQNSIMNRGFRKLNCINQIDAFYQSLVFFKKKNYNKAYLLRLKVYFNSISNNLTFLNSNPEYNDNSILLFLRKHFRKALKMEAKEGWLSFKNDKWAFDLAYPRLMKVYWWIFTIVRKL